MSVLTEHIVSTILLLSGWLRQKWALGNQNGEWIFFQCLVVEQLCKSSRIFLYPVSQHRVPPMAGVLTGHWCGRGMGWPGPVWPGPGPLAPSAPRWWLFRSCLAVAQRCNYTWTRRLGGSEGGTSRKGFSPDPFSCYTRYWFGCCRWPGAVAAEILSWGSYQLRNCWIWCLRSEKGKQGGHHNLGEAHSASAPVWPDHPRHSAQSLPHDAGASLQADEANLCDTALSH